MYTKVISQGETVNQKISSFIRWVTQDNDYPSVTLSEWRMYLFYELLFEELLHDNKEKFVVMFKFGFHGNQRLTLQETAQFFREKLEWNVRTNGIRGLEVSALRQLREPERLAKLQYFLERVKLPAVKFPGEIQG